MIKNSVSQIWLMKKLTAITEIWLLHYVYSYLITMMVHVRMTWQNVLLVLLMLLLLGLLLGCCRGNSSRCWHTRKVDPWDEKWLLHIHRWKIITISKNGKISFSDNSIKTSRSRQIRTDCLYKKIFFDKNEEKIGFSFFRCRCRYCCCCC